MVSGTGHVVLPENIRREHESHFSKHLPSDFQSRYNYDNSLSFRKTHKKREDGKVASSDEEKVEMLTLKRYKQ